MALRRRSPFIVTKLPGPSPLARQKAEPEPEEKVEQQVEQKAGSLSAGGGLISGGSIQSGGALRSGGALASGGQIAQSVRDQYHGLMRTKQHDWEAIREAASQGLGHAPSLMWGPIPTGKFGGSEHHIRTLARAHSPHIAAKLLEAEHAHQGEGGGLSAALAHVTDGLRRHTGTVVQAGV